MANYIWDAILDAESCGVCAWRCGHTEMHALISHVMSVLGAAILYALIYLTSWSSQSCSQLGVQLGDNALRG